MTKVVSASHSKVLISVQTEVYFFYFKNYLGDTFWGPPVVIKTVLILYFFVLDAYGILTKLVVAI